MGTLKAWPTLAVVTLSLWFSTVALASVGVEYDRRSDFSQYQTFAWAKGKPAPEPWMEALVRLAVERELTAQGLKKVEGQADLYISASTTKRTERVINVNDLGYSGFYWRQWGGAYPPTTQVDYFPLGRMKVELLDGDSRERVWLGVGIGYVFVEKPSQVAKLIERVTRKMFKRFPRR
ncbi:MAG: DUF4136 domain-containing protein [Acidiferrobacterales bacterium]